MKTIYEQCNKLIRDRLPHLQELSFGCEVKYMTDCDVVSGAFKDDSIRMQIDYKNASGGYTLKAQKESIEEILGHPIQINDWLGLLGGHYALSGRGSIIKEDGEWDNFLPHFDISKPFDSQSEPFYEWLLAELT